MYLFLISLLIFAVFYFQCCLIQPPHFQIVQTSIVDFNPQLLLEKQPIYLEDPVVNPADLFNTVFRYLYVKHTLSISDRKLLKQNLSKYVIIYNDNSNKDVVVKIIHPSNKTHIPLRHMHLYSKNFNVSTNDLLNPSFVDQLENKKVSIVDVILKPYRSLILPINWYYQTTLDDALEIHLHDIVSMLYCIM